MFVQYGRVLRRCVGVHITRHGTKFMNLDLARMLDEEYSRLHKR